jgi:tetratricopeptide (TPR) repeat protein
MTPPAITHCSFSRRAILTAAAGLALACTCAPAAELTQIVLQNGRAVPLASVALQGDKFVVKTALDGFAAGATIPLATVDHVFGEKPAAINQAIALLLTGKAAEAVKLLEPILAEHKDTAKLPGNFWLEAARAALVANSLEGAFTACGALGKDISDATPAQGVDPFVTLSKALLLPLSAKVSEREAALRDLSTDNLPADLCAYACYFRAELLKKDKREAEALEAYLSVSCLFPSGGLVVNGVAQLKAVEILTAQGRREEAMALVHAAARNTKDTPAAKLAAELLKSIK